MSTDRKRASPRRYTAEDRERVLAAIEANRGNVHLTAQQEGVPRSTVRRWFNEQRKNGNAATGSLAEEEAADDRPEGDQPEDLPAANAPHDPDLRAGWSGIVHMALEKIPGKMEEAPLGQVASVAAFATRQLVALAEPTPVELPPADLERFTDEELIQFERILLILLNADPDTEGLVGKRADGEGPTDCPTDRPQAEAAGVEPALPPTPLPAGKPDAGAELDDDTIPLLHRWLDAELFALRNRRKARLAVIAPRESAKTTIITLAYVLRCAVEGAEPYIILLSDSKEQAEKFLAGIRAELEADPTAAAGPRRLATIYPRACGRGPEWRKNHLRLRNGVVIEALGRGCRIRGRKNGPYRPTLIVLDDCQSNRDVASAEERAKALRWFTAEVVPSGSDRTNIISVGSALHREALAVQVQAMADWTGAIFSAILSWPERTDLWREWERLATNLSDEHRQATAAAFYEANRVEMDRGGVSFWPAYKPLASLMMKRAEIGERQFDVEYQGNPGAAEGAEWPPAYFDHPTLRFDDWPRDIATTVIALDPSKGHSDPATDYQATAIVSVTPDGNLWVDCECRREPVPEMVSRAVELAKQYRPAVLVVETNQGLDLLAPEFDRYLAAAKLVLPVQTVEHYSASKVSRIRRLGPYLARGQLRIRHSPGGDLLVNQLRDFPLGAHDDAPDAVELAIRRLELMSGGK